MYFHVFIRRFMPGGGGVLGISLGGEVRLGPSYPEVPTVQLFLLRGSYVLSCLYPPVHAREGGGGGTRYILGWGGAARSLIP